MVPPLQNVLFLLISNFQIGVELFVLVFDVVFGLFEGGHFEIGFELFIEVLRVVAGVAILARRDMHFLFSI